MSFAETSRLRYRAYRSSDLERVIAVWNDPRISRTSPTYVIPVAESKLQKDIPDILEKAFMVVIIEAKEPNKDGDDWVGMAMLTNVGTPKNREVMLGIMLDVSFWDQGYGELTCLSC
jgi:RimJ/RimL family protein N-acetyltransferase